MLKLLIQQVLLKSSMDHQVDRYDRSSLHAALGEGKSGSLVDRDMTHDDNANAKEGGQKLRARKPTTHGSRRQPRICILTHYPLSTDDSTLFATQSIFILASSLDISQKYTMQRYFSDAGKVRVGVPTEPACLCRP